MTKLFRDCRSERSDQKSLIHKFEVVGTLDLAPAPRSERS